MSSTSFMPSMHAMTLKDEGELLYTTLVGMVMAAIFATGFHDDVERTLTNLAPEGTSYPFPSHTRPSAAKFASAVAGFLLGVFLWTLIAAIRWSLVRRLLTYRDWLLHPKSMKTKAWVLSLKVLMPRKKYLNAFQHVLPKYPLPKLSDTCKRALEVYEPLLTKEEFEGMEQDMKEFEKGEGPMLQALLEKRYQTEENWVSELWDNYAYLSQRTPILVNTSIGTETGINKSDLGMCERVKSTGRAASMAYAYLNFWEKIKDNTLPSILVLNLVPICAARYRYLMACTRLPGVPMDELKLYEDSKHIIVIRKGLMYRVEVYCVTPSGEEQILPAEVIQRQIEIIMEDTAALKESTRNPALFTGQGRTQWAQEREKLQLHKVNAASLKDVESAIFHIVMEETSPENLTDESRENLCSNGYNLWCDKSITLRVFENSRSGLHFEHATADATLFGRMLEFVWEFAKYDNQGNAVSGGDDPIFMPKQVHPPQRLDWDLSQFQNVIPKYEEDLNKLCNDVDLKVISLRRGKGEMKKCRVSPDGLMQMALQLAYYRMHKSTPKTYESASTRYFKLEIEARDSPDPGVTTSVYIYVLPATNRIRFVVNSPPSVVRDKKKKFIEVIGNITSSHVIIDDVAYHVMQNGRRDNQRSDVTIRLYDSRRKQQITPEKLRQQLQREKSKLEKLFGNCAVFQDNVSMEENDGTSLQIIVIIMLTLLLLIILIFSVLYCHMQRRYKRELEALAAGTLARQSVKHLTSSEVLLPPSVGGGSEHYHSDTPTTTTWKEEYYRLSEQKIDENAEFSSEEKRRRKKRNPAAASRTGTFPKSSSNETPQARPRSKPEGVNMNDPSLPRSRTDIWIAHSEKPHVPPEVLQQFMKEQRRRKRAEKKARSERSRPGSQFSDDKNRWSLKQDTSSLKRSGQSEESSSSTMRNSRSEESRSDPTLKKETKVNKDKKKTKKDKASPSSHEIQSPELSLHSGGPSDDLTRKHSMTLHGSDVSEHSLKDYLDSDVTPTNATMTSSSPSHMTSSISSVNQISDL